jgi:hypothetical protein
MPWSFPAGYGVHQAANRGKPPGTDRSPCIDDPWRSLVSRPSGEGIERCSQLDSIPRRGIPSPLRSTFAVSHDPGGLPLLELPDVFQSETLLGF